MRIRATFTHPHPAIGATTDAHLVVSLHGETDTDSVRPRVAVIPVVDRSGSMSAQHKLPLVTGALRHLSEHLASEDRLGLVTFDDRAEAPVPTRAADAAGVSAFNLALARTFPRGSTNLHDALAAAVTLSQRTSADTLTRIIVLTDGRANQGPTTVEALTAVLADRPDHVSVSFLGVGTDCDHTLLGQLAEAGGGSYGFIETAADAPSVLGAEVGGLLDAEAHQVTVSVTCNTRYATLAADAPLGYPGTREADTMTFTVAQVLRGVTRNIVIPVRLTGAGKAHARPVTCARVHLEALVDAEPFTVELRPKVKFTPTAGDLDASVVEIVDLARVADAVAEARNWANVGNFAGARSLLTGLALSSPAAQLIANDMSARYADQHTYAASAADLSSIAAMNRGSLSGGSRAFDTLIGRTVGGYYNDAQRAMAASTTAASGIARPAVAAPAAVNGVVIGGRRTGQHLTDFADLPGTPSTAATDPDDDPGDAGAVDGAPEASGKGTAGQAGEQE